MVGLGRELSSAEPEAARRRQRRGRQQSFHPPAFPDDSRAEGLGAGGREQWEKQSLGGSERRKLGRSEEEGVGVLHASLNQSFLLPGKEGESSFHL